MKRFVAKVILTGTLGLLAQETRAQSTYSIDWHTVDGGGGTSTGGVFSVSGSIGLPEAGTMSGGAFTLQDGFWSIIPEVTGPATIFDNTGGSVNGGEAATTNAWLANKFCLGPQAYQLDSVSLLLNSQDFSGAPGPPSTVRLQIYANDPVSGKPSASTGVIMNLSGLTNPITLVGGQQLVMWTNATPLTLAANTCYWVVLSTDAGIIGELTSFTMPTGDAAALGRGGSADAGGTWQPADTASNRKMLIQATSVGSPSPGAELAADGATAIPAGTGNFTGLPLAPGLSGSNLVFYGAGSSGQQGLYSTTRGLPQTPTRIADLNTAIPNGAGNFLSFGTEAGIIIVGGDILFTGSGAGSQQGIYLASHATPGALVRIADTAMAIPGGVGTFAGFQNGLGFNGADVVFVGNGSGGQQGIYGASGAVVGPPFKVADTTTAIPSGTGNFTGFPSGPALSGSEAAFIANGSGAQQGLYTVAVLAPPQVGSPLRIADTTTAIPGGSGNFTSFGSDQAHPIDPAMSGDRVAFVGSGSGGQQGIYGATVSGVGPPIKVADTTTAIPGGGGNFASFGAVSVSATDVAFLGHGAGGQAGIYDMTGGQLLKVIAVGDKIGVKALSGLSFSRGGLSGDPVAFKATFSDGSQGVYTIEVVPPARGLQITATEAIGNDMRLSFNSVAGHNYEIQSRAELSSGTWATLPGGPISATGATAQVTLTNALGQPQQFYRVQMVP
jgi:hypothetical protein